MAQQTIPKSKREIPINNLQAIANEHISYEIQMFMFTAQKMSMGGMNILENNAMLESFLIHARCLFDFLYPPSGMHDDDVVADDFYDDPSEFRSRLPTSLPISTYLKKRTGKEIAHLTYNRLQISSAEKIWNFADVRSQIGNALKIFFDNLPEERRSWFSTIVAG